MRRGGRNDSQRVVPAVLKGPRESDESKMGLTLSYGKKGVEGDSPFVNDGGDKVIAFGSSADESTEVAGTFACNEGMRITSIIKV